MHLPSDTPPPSARPVFIVDDEEEDRLLFCRRLQEAGVPNPCRAFASGPDFIDAMISVLRGAPAPLVCFLDVKLPGMSGFDVLRWIRCQRACDDIPVVMLSSVDGPRELGEAQHAGAQCYLAKFPTADQVRAMIDEATHVATASTATPFKVPCNLLHTGSQAYC